MFSIDTLALSETTDMLLKHPVTGEVLGEDEGKPVTFTLYGSASREYRKAVDTLVKAANKRGKKEATPAEKRQESVDFLVSLTVKAENILYNGAPLDNPTALADFYADEKFNWVREQINEAIGSVESFLPKEQTN